MEDKPGAETEQNPRTGESRAKKFSPCYGVSNKRERAESYQKKHEMQESIRVGERSDWG